MYEFHGPLSKVDDHVSAMFVDFLAMHQEIRD
jgi:hypothetical protein